MHVLGSTSLWDVRQAAKLHCRDAVPEVERAKAACNDAQGESDETSVSSDRMSEGDGDDEDGDMNVESRDRSRRSSRTNRRWTRHVKDGGSVFGIEGTLYADGRPGVRDYAA